MRMLGKVKGLSEKGEVLVRGDVAPKLGARIVDPNGKDVGKVSRVFGPVDKPYIHVRPAKGIDGNRIQGVQVYIQEEAGRCRERKGRRRG